MSRPRLLLHLIYNNSSPRNKSKSSKPALRQPRFLVCPPNKTPNTRQGRPGDAQMRLRRKIPNSRSGRRTQASRHRKGTNQQTPTHERRKSKYLLNQTNQSSSPLCVDKRLCPRDELVNLSVQGKDRSTRYQRPHYTLL